MSTRSELFARIQRAAIIVVLVAAGSLGGIYLGDALGFGRGRAVRSTIPILPAHKQRTVEPEFAFAASVGQPFPDVMYTTLEGKTGRTAGFFDGTPTVFLFWHMDCVSCVEQAHTWRSSVQPWLKEEVKQIACLSASTPEDNRMNAHLMKSMTTIHVDYDYFERDLRLVFLPTIIAVDGRGIIQHIQYEFSPLFDEGLITLVTNYTVREP